MIAVYNCDIDYGAKESVLSPGKALDPREIAAALAKMDRDNSGDVQFDEFYDWFENELTEIKVTSRPCSCSPHGEPLLQLQANTCSGPVSGKPGRSTQRSRRCGPSTTATAAGCSTTRRSGSWPSTCRSSRASR